MVDVSAYKRHLAVMHKTTRTNLGIGEGGLTILFMLEVELGTAKLFGFLVNNKTNFIHF